MQETHATCVEIEKFVSGFEFEDNDLSEVKQATYAAFPEHKALVDQYFIDLLSIVNEA